VPVTPGLLQDVQMDALHVSDYPGPSGHSSAAALGRQGRAPGIHDTYPSAHRCLAPSSLLCSSSNSSGSCCTSSSGRTPTSLVLSFSAPASRLGLLVTGLRNRQHSAASATSACCYHYCYGGVRDCTSSGGSCITAFVRVSTCSSFYCRSWIRDWLRSSTCVCASTSTATGCALASSFLFWCVGSGNPFGACR
jgi:hypothetical protein